MNTWSPDLYQKALVFASYYHQNQSYGGAKPEEQIPYLAHVVAVAMEVTWVLAHSSEEMDGNLAVLSALLHDTLEDTQATYQQIQQQFGEAVAQGVLALTKNEKLESKEQQMQDSLKRICEQPKEIWVVKMADRIVNLQHPPFYWKKKKIVRYHQEAQLIYQKLHQANAVAAKRLEEKITRYWQQFCQ